VVVCTWSLVLAAGCSSAPDRVRPGRLDAGSAGRQTVSAYDADQDGFLSRPELERCPAILQALDQYDADGDGRVSAAEITRRIEKWQTLKVGLMGFCCRVTLDDRPLGGATVRLVPESFLSEVLPPAAGTTDDTGSVSPSISAEDQPDPSRPLAGLRPGLYKVEIRHPTIALPARYHAQTTLGQQVAPDDPQITAVHFALTSRAPGE
jgi:hypothetical protein